MNWIEIAVIPLDLEINENILCLLTELVWMNVTPLLHKHKPNSQEPNPTLRYSDEARYEARLNEILITFNAVQYIKFEMEMLKQCGL